MAHLVFPTENNGKTRYLQRVEHLLGYSSYYRANRKRRVEKENSEPQDGCTTAPSRKLITTTNQIR